MVEIYRTARRHGITDEDTLHAIDQAIVIVEQDEERTLYLGPARAGNLLEVVTLERVGSEPLAIPLQPHDRAVPTPSPRLGGRR